jgi:hypothetical protein
MKMKRRFFSSARLRLSSSGVSAGLAAGSGLAAVPPAPFVPHRLAGGISLQHREADHQEIPRLEGGARHLLAVHEDAVRAAEVFHGVTRVRPEDLGVALGNVPVVEGNLAAFAADIGRIADEREARTLLRPLDHQQAQPLPELLRGRQAAGEF